MTKLLYKPASLFTAMILMYLTYTWGNHVHEQGKRKNPADYENDQWNRPAEDVSLWNFLFLKNSSIKKIFMGKMDFWLVAIPVHLINMIQFSSLFINEVPWCDASLEIILSFVTVIRNIWMTGESTAKFVCFFHFFYPPTGYQGTFFLCEGTNEQVLMQFRES